MAVNDVEHTWDPSLPKLPEGVTPEELLLQTRDEAIQKIIPSVGGANLNLTQRATVAGNVYDQYVTYALDNGYNDLVAVTLPPESDAGSLSDLEDLDSKPDEIDPASIFDSLVGEEDVSIEDNLPADDSGAQAATDLESEDTSLTIDSLNSMAVDDIGDIDKDAAQNIRSNFNTNKNNFLGTSSYEDGSLFTFATSFSEGVPQLYQCTQEKLDFDEATVLSDLKDNMLSKWYDYASNILSNIDSYIRKIDESNAGSGSGDTGSFSSLSSSSGGSGANAGSTITNPDNYIQSAVVGTLVFSMVTPLYSQLGGNSTIQSSLTSSYEVVGIISQDGKYYYKIYDTNLKQFYYAEVNSNSQLSTGYNELLKSKEGENTMMLTSPNIGENVFAKMSDQNTAYFIKDKIEHDNIPYALVVDGTDGNTYYIPIDSTVEVVSIDTVVPGVTIVDSTMSTTSNASGGGNNGI